MKSRDGHHQDPIASFPQAVASVPASAPFSLAVVLAPDPFYIDQRSADCSLAHFGSVASIQDKPGGLIMIVLGALNRAHRL